jgi:CheY-like chemotaxis protein
MAKSPNHQLLTPNQVAEALSVAPVTVRQWAQKGLLAAQVTAGGHRRFEMDVVVAFARARGMRLGGLLLESSANRVLVVDDDQQFNAFLCELLRAEQPQLSIATAFDGFDAGRQVAQHAPSLVLLDIMMPGLDGIEVCRRLKEDPASEHIRIVAMTGHYSDSLAMRINAVGAHCLLQKPFSFNELFTACGWRDAPTKTRAAKAPAGVAERE